MSCIIPLKFFSIKASYNCTVMLNVLYGKRERNVHNIHVTILAVVFGLASSNFQTNCDGLMWKFSNLFVILSTFRCLRCFSGSSTKLCCKQSNFQLSLLIHCGLIWISLCVDFTNHILIWAIIIFFCHNNVSHKNTGNEWCHVSVAAVQSCTVNSQLFKWTC